LSWIGAVSGNTSDAAHLYNNTANWVGGVIDDSFSGVTFTSNTTLYFNASRTTGGTGMNLGYSGGFNLVFESSSSTTQTLTLAGNISGAFGGASVTIGNSVNGLDLDLGAATRTFNLSAGDTLAILNTVSGGVGLTKSGAGTLTLDGANSYSGTTSATAGQLNIGSATAVGTGAFNVSGGKIDNVSGAALTLANNNVATLGSFTFVGTNDLNLGTGAVTISGNRTFTVTAGNLTIGGAIGETGGSRKLTKAGAGTLTLSGVNTFSNGMTLSAGQLNIDNATAIGNGTFTISGGVIDNTSGSAVTLSSNNLQSWNGNFTFVGSNSLDLGTGAVTLSANRIVTTDAETLTVDGVISGAHSLTASGAGTLVLTGSNTYSGGTTITGGTLVADNATGSATGSAAVVVSSGAVLAGTGTISGAVTVNSGGTLAPGDGGTAILNTGALTFAAGSNLDIALTGNTAGTGYSQVNVSGAATLTGSNLILSGTRSGHDGTALTVLASTSAVTGTFTGLAQSGIVSNNGVNYTINYTGGGGDNIVLTANLAATSTALSSSANPSVFGQSATFTATVTSGSAGTPTGSVTFYDGGISLGTTTLNGSAIASLSVSTLNVGSHSITAVYSGDSDFTTSTSSATNQTVNQDSSTTTLVPSANPSVFGQSVTLTATITANSPGSGTATGTVTFEDGTAVLGTGTLNGSGQATCNTSALLIGSNSLTAVYAGDANFSTSTSSAVSHTVNQDTTTTSLTPSISPSVFGQSVTLTATVTGDSPGSGTPTGTVTFKDGTTTLGTGTLNGSGQATFNTSALLIGSNSLTAVYAGDTDFSTSTSSAVSQTVNQDGTTSSLTPSANPSVFGQSVTLTTIVSANSPGTGTPTGTVTFMDGSTTLGTGTLNGSGQATFSTSALLLGSNSLTAVYAGDTDFSTSTSSAVSQTVNQDGTTTSLAPSVNPSVFGQSVTFTATVSANSPGAGTPTGIVTFEDGTATLGTGTLNGSGQAAFSTSGLSIGANSLTAVYAGDTDFTASASSAISQTVNQDSSTTTLVPSANPSVFGQSVTLTATVTANSPGSGTPTGTVTFEDGTTTLGTAALNGSGQATFSAAALLIGSNSLTAVYSGNSDFTASTSSATTQTVDQDSTTTSLTPSANPSVFGESVTFTATVASNAPGAGTPTGTITFYDGSNDLGTATLNGSAIATIALSTLSVSTHSITAVYSGDTDFTTSTSSATSQIVNQDSSTTTLTQSANPSVYGQSVTLTATVSANSPGTGTPTGAVTFKDGTTTLGTGTLNGSGQATFSTSALLIGSNSLTAVYVGDTNFTTSSSSATSQTVNQDSSTTILTPSVNPSVFGQSVTLTATVSPDSPGAGTPTGTVTFEDGTTTLGTATLNGSGQATFNTSALVIGSNSLTAVYAGDTDFTTSTSSALSETVNQDGTTTSLTPSANPSVFGEPVTFTATVTSNTPGAGTPTGTITFYDGLNNLGTATLNGSAIATMSLSTLTVATHSITAVYSGDSDFITSTSSATSQTVNQDSSTTTLVPSINPSVFGESVALTATVVANSPGAGTPTGTVTFKDGSATLGTGTLNGSGQVTFSTSALPIGGNSLTAVYSGDSDFATSTSSATSQTVDQDSTTTSLTPSVNPSVFGQSVTFTATVAANTPGAGTPTGTITLYDGSNNLGTATLDGSAVATIALSNLSVASHSITAIYGGDSDFITSTSSATSQMVNQDSSTTTLLPSINPSVFGQGVTLTATVTPNSPGTGTPTGIVTFYNGSSSLGTATLNNSGIATLSSSALPVGSNSISVVYGGDAAFAASTSSTLTQIVNQDATASVVGSSADPIVFGEPVTFTATVTASAPGAGTPTGTVTFIDGATTLGMRTLDVSGQATLSTSVLLIGTGPISIIYAGDENFSASTSPAISQTVDPDSTSVALTSSANPELFGQIVTFTATVTANSPGSGIPTGSVTFDDGSTFLGTGTLDGAGEATLAISILSPRTHSITAVFSGDTDFTANISSPLSQVVDPLPPVKLAFSQQPAPIIAGDPITTTIVIEDALGNIVTTDNSSVTLSVNSGSGSLSGNFSLNAQNGIATFSSVSLTMPGFYTLVASDGLLSSAISSGFDVTEVGSHVVFASQPTAVTAGDPATTMTANLMTPSGAIDSTFNGTVSLSIAGGPPGGQILGLLDVVAQNGIAAWSNLRFTRAGSYTLQASTLRELSAQTAPIAVNPGPVAQTVVSTQTAMSWQFGLISPSPVIALTDQFGNIVPDAPANITASILSGPPGAVLKGTTTVPVHNGYATFSDLSVNLSGIYSIAFSDGAQTPIVISGIKIVAIPARRFSFNGIPLGEQSILLQQQRNAPSYMARTPIMLATQFAVAPTSSPQFFSAALTNLAPTDFVNPQFIASPIYEEASPNSILNAILDSYWDPIWSQRQISSRLMSL
jgi:autotransporter-associated beta strand protein